MRPTTILSTLLCCIFVLTTATTRATPVSPAERTAFIQQHLPLAEREFYRAGMCVSITLAQLILESNYGKSPLVSNANNYFCIKTKDVAHAFLMKDDEPTDSKFAMYGSVEECYMARTAFLQRERYANLFKLRRDDYEGWAYELQRAGFATDKQYAQKLIAIVKENRLYEYDQPDAFVAEADNTMNNTIDKIDETDESRMGLLKDDSQHKPKVVTTVTKPNIAAPAVAANQTATKATVTKPAAKPMLTPIAKPTPAAVAKPAASNAPSNNRYHYTHSNNIGGN